MATRASAGDGMAVTRFVGPSIKDILDEHRGMGPGFDLCRIGLSLAIMLIHSSWLANPSSGQLTGWLHPFVASVLGLFFGLSGFLVTGSALRLRDIRAFLTFRVLRIMPALMVEVTLCAVVLGSLLTSENRADYYSDPQFYSYFRNIVGWVHFQLPGMFASNPFPRTVNGNLWTLHPEFMCYGMMMALMVSGLVYSRKWMTIGWAAATMIGCAFNLRFGTFELGFHFSGSLLVYSFMTGVVMFHWRHRIPVNRLLFLVACVTSYILLLLPHTALVAQLPLLYVIVWIGMQKLPRIELLQRGDYSYGIYLYGFPIQQTLLHLFPVTAQWWLLFPLSTAITFGIAAASWHLVEKPALKLKKFVQARPPAGAGHSPAVARPA